MAHAHMYHVRVQICRMMCDREIRTCTSHVASRVWRVARRLGRVCLCGAGAVGAPVRCVCGACGGRSDIVILIRLIEIILIFIAIFGRET